MSSETLIKNRRLGFLIWQSISSTIIFLILKLFIVSPLSPTSSTTTTTKTHSILTGLFTFSIFQISHLGFSLSLSTASSPQLARAASPFQLAAGGLFSHWTVEFRRRARLSLSLVALVAAAAVSGFLGAVSVCWVNGGSGFGGVERIWRVGFRGFICGLLYGSFFVYKQRWVLEFPIIQRPPYFSFKMGLPSAITRAFKLSIAAYLSSAVLLVFLADEFKGQLTMGEFITGQIIFYIGTFAVFLCWEISHHLHQVLHTKRFIFAPPKGSAAAERNPSEPLLAALEQSTPNSLLQHLAYLDLCMVCENNVDTWRRAAFFEETGETYKKVIAVCLRPLEQLATKLGEVMEPGSVDKLSNQLRSPTDSPVDSKNCEPLNSFQLCAWCARTAAFLTAHSHKEDRFGVAQLSGSNAAVISTLLSCLLAVEAFMGKKTNLQPPHLLAGPAGIKWAPLNTGRRDVGVVKKRGGPAHSKAYAMADVLRTSIYCIVSAFHGEMMSSAKANLLEKDWITSAKPQPLFGTRELLLQKLRLFLDYQAS
ncbi:hypothetical protein ACOSQ2_024172 [Xanthoceras sorbifolium]|uniref:Nucleoporin protein Ndc1-Nup n=1 Tax=Xanthoceras sorbifolium TaxID=99658 RepID=A0ABQ8H9S3_9ROSI|nr:hypothetical protein JRO89_XS13G0239300 [Xanthoceras sorbifolium]